MPPPANWDTVIRFGPLEEFEAALNALKKEGAVDKSNPTKCHCNKSAHFKTSKYFKCKTCPSGSGCSWKAKADCCNEVDTSKMVIYKLGTHGNQNSDSETDNDIGRGLPTHVRERVVDMANKTSFGPKAIYKMLDDTDRQLPSVTVPKIKNALEHARRQNGTGSGIAGFENFVQGKLYHEGIAENEPFMVVENPSRSRFFWQWE